MSDFLYPPSPAHVYPEQLTPSPAFRKQAMKVIAAILLFLLTYIVLLAVAIALAVACCFAGIMLVVHLPKIITIMIGLGLIAVGVSVLYFLVKFVFAVSRDENPGRIAVTEAEQPMLFAFIRRLAADTNTQFPKKIFLSPEVNACVFYHSSFWSMFLPVRKNLEIGLGLVNSVNISEFKAVMAHEFGHFSQRSMKLGSFTYNTNRIIYNMLYDNSGYAAFLEAWGNIHSYFALFAGLTLKIAQGIQWILKGMYKLINKSYLALSREMEFHADTIAASVAGGNNLVTALSRVEVAGGCYTSAINTANDRLKEKKVARNIFRNQLTVFRSMASEYKLPLKQGLPEISYQFIRSFSRSRVNYRNQWASHPTLEERKQHLELAGMDAPPDETSAWAIFREADQLQENLTAHLYRSVQLEADVQHYDAQEFDAWHAAQQETYRLPAAYKGFYNSRYIDTLQWDFDQVAAMPAPATFEALFNEENGQLQAAITSHEEDKAIINAIKDRQVEAGSFDFDGVKYRRSDCDSILEKLEADIAELRERQELADKQAFAFFYAHANGMQAEVLERYRQFQAFCKRNDAYLQIVNRINRTLQPFYDGGLTLEQVAAAVENLRNNDEWELKRAFRGVLDDSLITPATPGQLHDRITAFIDARYTYFEDQAFRNEELSTLYDLAIKVANELGDIQFRYYKQLLETQLAAYKK
ncbi:M48 family metallopeptidase [Chitinophaga japonensis]|uniref:Zn-dependent protease with chaperone function n=1 Tax=Chitinophaga japonensis TaxID=104662 RepID=A0A562T8N7_CHIJA|nr:M48 family metallopeptidase [Chitinophaga japonensis]TWI89296.1 Zn-dependent protease with chaperone function [Chitinophaga japonensis]